MRFILMVAYSGLVACDGGDTDVGAGALENRIAALEALVQGLQTTVNQQSTMLTSQKATIDQQATTLTAQQNTVDQAAAVLQYLRVEAEDLIVEGANFYVQDGTGRTDPLPGQQPNGKGNLIIGYNERSTGTGAHNLIIGPGHSYTSYGGFAVGAGHTISGSGSAICGGINNVASGDGASVAGGLQNTASGNYATVSGGSSNVAQGGTATVSGGSSNVAQGGTATVSGGSNGLASGSRSVVSGGSSGEASASFSVVSGGNDGLANTLFAHFP